MHGDICCTKEKSRHIFEHKIMKKLNKRQFGNLSIKG